MDKNENIEMKKSRTRTNPPKKWSVAEEKSLIEYLTEYQEFEKPTAQTYYKRFANEKSVPVDWKLARSKVRNMRVSYNKAKAWEGSTGAGSMEGETVKSTLFKMCSFYYEFDEIFGSRIIGEAIIEDSLEIDSNLFNSTEIDIEQANITTESAFKIETLPSSSRKGIYSRTAVSDIMQIQSEMLTIKKQKMDQEASLKEREMEIKERELAAKENEVELKEKELFSQEKLKILELEMKERVAMEELKYKYK